MSTCYIDTKALREEHDYHRISSTSYVCAKCAHDMCQHEPRPCEPLSLEALRAGFILLRKKLFTAELVADRLAALEAELASAREAERVQRERAERERDRAYLYRNAVPESADYVDALDHIMRAARRSRTQSRRLRWIEARARCALEGGEDWKELDLPRFSESNQRYLKARIAELEEALAAGGDQ